MATEKHNDVKTEIVWSPVEDKHFGSNLKTSPVWKNCYREEEITEALVRKHNNWFAYHVKFDGLKPIQLTKVVQK